MIYVYDIPISRLTEWAKFAKDINVNEHIHTDEGIFCVAIPRDMIMVISSGRIINLINKRGDIFTFAIEEVENVEIT